MDVAELTAIVDDLRIEGSDVSDVEAKRAAGGLPQSLPSTISAFANTPGGGLILLGLDENAGFKTVAGLNAANLQAALTAQGRNAVDPPLVIDTGWLKFEGNVVVWGRVDELDASAKPCKVRKGAAYLRSYDGDYQISLTEEQAFIANRSTPAFDRKVVDGASRVDLDDDAIAAFVRESRRASSALARFSDDELLIRTGVLTETGLVTLAGLLTLGKYPQQFFPQLVIHAHIPSSTPGERALDIRKFDGPIPLMLDEALLWVQRNTRRAVRFGASGHGRDEPEYPSEAIRELLSNALVHRDLGPYALGEPITLQLQPSRLVLSNPGGLYGLTKSQLGTKTLSSTRNSLLARICERVRTPSDERVVELVSSGIRTVLDSVRAAGMVAPQFHDQAIRFTVLMPNHALLSPAELAWVSELPGAVSLTDAQRHALVSMRNGKKWNNSTLRAEMPMDSAEARALLKDLVDRGLARAVGEKKWRVYELAEDYKLESTQVAEASDPTDALVVSVPEHRPMVELKVNERTILQLLERGRRSLRALSEESELTPKQIRYSLDKLRASGLVETAGTSGRGRGTVYQLRSED